MLPTIFALMLAVAAISYTVTSTKLFEAPRAWVIRNTYNADYGKGYLGELVSCPYCFSHWVTLMLVVIYRPLTVWSGLYWLDLAITGFAIVMGANIITQVLRAVGRAANGTEVRAAYQPIPSDALANAMTDAAMRSMFPPLYVTHVDQEHKTVTLDSEDPNGSEKQTAAA